MAIALTHRPDMYDVTGRLETFRVDFVLSGSYSSGGETVDLTAFPRMHVRDKAKIRRFEIYSTNGVYSYSYVAGSNLTNGKIKIFTALGTELGAGAYAAGYTADTPFAIIEVLKT